MTLLEARLLEERHDLRSTGDATLENGCQHTAGRRRAQLVVTLLQARLLGEGHDLRIWYWNAVRDAHNV